MMIGGEEEGRFFDIFFSFFFHLLVIDISITPCLIPWHERFLELTGRREKNPSRLVFFNRGSAVSNNLRDYVISHLDRETKKHASNTSLSIIFGLELLEFLRS